MDEQIIRTVRIRAVEIEITERIGPKRAERIEEGPIEIEEREVQLPAKRVQRAA